jgi:hypothetical protein
MVLVSIGQRSVTGFLFAVSVFCFGFMLTMRAANMCLLLGSIASTLALSELSLKLSFQDPLTSSPDSSYMKPIYWSKSDLGFQPPPGRHTSKKLTSKGEVVYDAVYSIGEDGFRITPIIHTGASIYINFFGCSLMFGEGLNDDETLPYFLHELDLRVSVKNFAWHGYGAHQALRILESTRDTRGDINFLLTSPWHAERSACVPDYSKGSPRYILSDDGRVALDGTCGFQFNLVHRVLNRSYIYQLIRVALREDQDRQIDLYLAIIERMNYLSQARNQRFIIGFYKAENAWFTGKYSNETIVEQFMRMGIEVIDLTLARSADQLSREYYLHPLDKHPSAQANKVRAKLLAEYLDKELLATKTHRS